MARRALVTGATGFVGGRLAAALADRGWVVRCLVRDRSRAQALADRGFELHEADVLDAEALRGAGEGVEVAYYLIHAMGRGTSPGRVRGTRAAGRAELRRDGEAGGSRPERLPGRAGRPPRRRTCAAATGPPRSSPSWGPHSPTSGPG